MRAVPIRMSRRLCVCLSICLSVCLRVFGYTGEPCKTAESIVLANGNLTLAWRKTAWAKHKQVLMDDTWRIQLNDASRRPAVYRCITVTIPFVLSAHAQVNQLHWLSLQKEQWIERSLCSIDCTQITQLIKPMQRHFRRPNYVLGENKGRKCRRPMLQLSLEVR